MRFKSDDQRKAMFAKKKFYHGSAGFRGRVIGADGLIPPSQIDMPTSKDEMRGSEFDDYVFLTTNKDLAKTHAERRARHWEDTEYGPIVYEVELEEGQVVPDTFDPIRYPDSFKHKGIISSDKLKRVKFSDVGFDPRKTLELLDAGMLDPHTLTDEQKAQVEVVQEEIKVAGRKSLKELNERIERGDTYKPKELWSRINFSDADDISSIEQKLERSHKYGGISSEEYGSMKNMLEVIKKQKGVV